MDPLMNDKRMFAAIRRLMRAILGHSERGSLASTGNTGMDPVLALSGQGGFYSCFPGPMTWNQSYMRGMEVCPYVDAFWRACSDDGEVSTGTTKRGSTT